MIKKYLTGNKLYGDDFNLDEIKKWYDDEIDAYADLYSPKKENYKSHELNKFHGFNKLKSKNFKNVLSFGGSTGAELLPIINKIKNITIIDSSTKLNITKLNNIPVNYMMPTISGKIKFKNNYFDLVTCLSVLHHIPNVSFVISELTRVTKGGGYIIIHEPVVSMGNWNYQRKGLTKRERGIPKKYFDNIILNNNLIVVYATPVQFPILKLLPWLNFNSKFAVRLDYLLSNLFKWNNSYHAKNIFQKIRPIGIFYVLKKSD